MSKRRPYPDDVQLEVRAANREGRPVRLTSEQFDELHTRHSPAKLARLFCVDCMGGAPSEVARCTSVTCHLYPLRFDRSAWESPKTMRRVLGNVADGDDSDAESPEEGSGGTTPHRKTIPPRRRDKSQRAKGAA